LRKAIKLNSSEAIKSFHAGAACPYIALVITGYTAYQPADKMILAVEIVKPPIRIGRKLLGI
jgi:hypothetical protein